MTSWKCDRKLNGFVGIVFACALLLGACDDSATDDDPNDESTGGTGAGGSGGSGGSEDPNTGGTDDSGSGGTGVGVGGLGGAFSQHCPIQQELNDCSGERVAVRSLQPLDLYVMFDVSGSMENFIDEEETTRRFDAVRAAMSEFLAKPESADIGMGLGYFGQQPIGETSCDPADYETPAVPIDSLSSNQSLIEDSLADAKPTGERPTHSAIEAACRYAGAYQSENPDHHVAILLVTDGEPQTPVTQCNPAPTVELAATAAAACLQGSPSLATYVLGIGPLLDSLDAIAVAGGTESAFLVEDGKDPVLEALNDIRDARGSCQASLPGEVTDLDPLQLNLVRTDASCSEESIEYVVSAESCDPSSGGWYLDDPESPLAVHLCPASCVAAREPGAKVHFVQGCEPVGP